MTVTPLSGLDLPLGAATQAKSATGLPAPASASLDFAGAVSKAIGAASDALGRADRAEHAFANGRGGLQEMTLERAQADIALSIASATTTHVAQSLQTILGMQV